jgi:riboflavin biosynthesis pyrimidine reductase
MSYNRKMDWAARFEALVDRKTTAASTARIPGYSTAETHVEGFRLSALGNHWTVDRFDGRFFESWPADRTLPAVNTVFVQSADGNTGTQNPMELGGGLTDKHLIYEGLSGVHADAILTTAATLGSDDAIMATWHPSLVALRIALGLPRFPAQVVVTRRGELGIESTLLYNVPELRVFILTDDHGAKALERHVRPRPWIEVLSAGSHSDLAAGLRMLRSMHGVVRVSSVGGRTLATQLIDAGVVQDLYLTTSPRAGGEPDTPFYTGSALPPTDLIVKKVGLEDEAGVVFEHLLLRPRSPQDVTMAV